MSADPPRWNPLDQPVDKVIMAGRITPGIAEITGADSPRKWDESSGPGLSGALLLYRGNALSHFSINLYLYTVEDWNDWAAFRPFVLKKPLGKVPRAFDVSHPQLAEVGIHSCVIENVHAPEQTDNGVWIIQIPCIEFRKLKAEQGKPDGSAATPADPVDDFIGGLKDQFNKLAQP
jgi:hypothetical protein